MSEKQPVKQVVIVGGGTAGWITASLLVKMLGKSIKVTLVESDDIGTIGVGEATIPPIIQFNDALGINEAEFMRETKATIKLGIQFENWGQRGDAYMHAFGDIGKSFPFCSFHHFWLKHRQAGGQSSYWDYSLNYQAAIAGNFAHLPRMEQAGMNGLVYAYHFDAGLYAAFLRKRCEASGVTRIEGRIEQVIVNEQSGFVDSITLANGTEVSGDLFIDCSGLHALLIEKTLNAGFEDWSHWLPCDSALAVPTEKVEPIIPYTRSVANHAGWRWRIPLQHRTGNGLVYSSKYMSDDEAKALLLSELDAPALAEPKLIKFRTGRRRLQWAKNVVAIGLSSGFLEPLESTSIHLIQTGVIRLVKSFPHQGIKQSEVDEYNRQSEEEYKQIRDFIILHYKLTQRSDSRFWRDCQRMVIPDSLARRIQLFADTAKVYREQDELFSPIAWQQVMIGQNLIPDDFHPLVNALTDQQLDELMQHIKTIVSGTVKNMPTHDTFLQSLNRV